MDITEKKAFRKSFLGGFSKEDVNKYIEESTEKYTAKIKDAEEKFLAADRERSELATKLSAAEARIEELIKKNEEFEKLTEKHNSLTAEHANTMTKLTQREEELEKANAEISELSSKVSALNMVESEYTARKAELADIEISARSRAGEIISDAEREAQSKRCALDEELSLRRKNFEAKRDELFRETGDVVGGISRLMDSLKSEVDSMDSRITRIADAVKNNVSTLSDAVSDAQDKVGSIRARLSESDQ